MEQPNEGVDGVAAPDAAHHPVNRMDYDYAVQELRGGVMLMMPGTGEHTRLDAEGQTFVPMTRAYFEASLPQSGPTDKCWYWVEAVEVGGEDDLIPDPEGTVQYNMLRLLHCAARYSELEGYAPVCTLAR